MDIYFTAYGNHNFKNSKERLRNEALNYNNIFKDVFIYNEELLDEEFYQKHKEFISQNMRGGGYWVWKPYIILESLKKIKEGDILLYCDAGCSLNKEGEKRFMEYIDITNKYDILCMYLEDIHTEKKWNKMDTIMAVTGDSNDEKILDTPQCISTLLFLKKSDKTVKLIEEWQNYCNNYHLIDDTASILPNDITFREHRHDQSVLSLLIKKHGYKSIRDETYWEPNWIDYKMYPIHARRWRY